MSSRSDDKSSTSAARFRKRAWSRDEDLLLIRCVEKYGAGKWNNVPRLAGLNRCCKSCRLRWSNYLDPSINRSSFGEDEDELIIRLHKLLGNKWSLIAGRLPNRTANDIKNYWNRHLSKKVLKISEDTNINEGGSIVVRPIRPQPRAIPVNANHLTSQKEFGAERQQDGTIMDFRIIDGPDCDKLAWANNMMTGDVKSDHAIHFNLDDITPEGDHAAHFTSDDTVPEMITQGFSAQPERTCTRIGEEYADGVGEIKSITDAVSGADDFLSENP